MIRALIVDDEPDAVQSIQLSLNEFCPEVKVVGTAGDGLEAATRITELKPDLVFLDIEMPRASGFDLLEKMQNRTFEVIFITAYNEYALRAFRFSATDYLLKPVDPDLLVEAVNKAGQKIKTSHFSDNLDILRENLSATTPVRLAISTTEGIEYLHIQNIVRIEAEGSYSQIFLTGNIKITVSKPLRDFQRLLNDLLFYRPHDSHIINLNHVKKVHFKLGGYIELSDNSIIPLSRRNKKEFLDKMSKLST